MSRVANKVAVNTAVQYFQLILNVLVGLVSVRLVFDALGASDYGTYDLIGGIIVLFSFISNSLSQTSMRFLSVSLGVGDDARVADTFRVCFWLHIFIALALCALLSLVGLFLFDGFLNIPVDRVPTARAVYYFMIVNLFLNIAVTPFYSLVGAHENFVFISLVQILDSFLKLAVAYVITLYAHDKLFLYGMLMVLITMVNTSFFVVFSTARFKSQISVRMASIRSMKEISGFAGWTMYDVVGSIATRQGYAVLLNTYFGTVVNAVFALARQIEGQLYTISASVINTMKPQIMISHGYGDSDRVFRLSMTAGKFGFSMMSLVSIPFIVLMPDVLDIWLKSDVPEGTVLFSRLIVAACMFEQLTRGLVYANQAEGNIKWFVIISASVRMLALPLSWVAFELGAEAYVSIVIFLVCEAAGSFSRVVILSRISSFSIREFVQSVLYRIIPPFLVSFAVSFALSYVFHGIWGLLINTAASAVCYSILLYSFGLTENEKTTVKNVLGSLMRKFR